MKNKGRKHLASSSNCKGWLTHITRPINKMGKGDKYMTKYLKKKWSKRVRGYLKTQKFKNLFYDNTSENKA